MNIEQQNIETALFILEIQKRILFLLSDIRAQVADVAKRVDAMEETADFELSQCSNLFQLDELEEAAHSSVTKQKMVSQRGK